MKIALISLFVPTVENYNGASALPYHIIEHRKSEIDINIYTWNFNNVTPEQIKAVEENLNVRITILKLSFLMRMFTKTPLFNIRAILKYPYLRYLSIGKFFRHTIKTEYNAVWIYGEEISHMSKYFNPIPVVTTTPDCEALYYSRILNMPQKLFRTSDYLRYTLMYRKYLTLARDFPVGANITYHLVGEEDCSFLKSINPQVSAYFIPHPHYHYDHDKSRLIDFSKPKLKILIAGRYDVYMKEAADEAMNMFLSNRQFISTYRITFLGKGWESHVKQLEKIGYEVSHILYAPIYANELIKHDIQLTPISVGTGTKGKVLDAFVNGLLVIGTYRAIENIQADDCKDFYLYTTGEELKQILNQIDIDRDTAKAIAESGRNTIKCNHDQSKIAKQFFNLFGLL